MARDFKPVAILLILEEDFAFVRLFLLHGIVHRATAARLLRQNATRLNVLLLGLRRRPESCLLIGLVSLENLLNRHLIGLLFVCDWILLDAHPVVNRSRLLVKGHIVHGGD